MYQVVQENQRYGLRGQGVLVRDLFTSYQEIGMFVHVLNEFEALPVHIPDIIEDYFGAYR